MDHRQGGGRGAADVDRAVAVVVNRRTVGAGFTSALVVGAVTSVATPAGDGRPHPRRRGVRAPAAVEALSLREHIEQMRPAGRFVARTLATLREEVTVGTDLLDIGARAAELVREPGATSCYGDYHPSFEASPFGHVICTSVNDAVLHGLPHRYRLRDGDLVSLDVAVSVDGWVADSAVSLVVGEPRERYAVTSATG